MYFLRAYTISWRCSNDSTQNATTPANNGGSISFSLSFTGQSALRADLAPDDDICQIHDIETIRAAVSNSEGTELVSESWPCSDHSGQLDNVPADNELVLVVEGTVSGNVHWKGEERDIQIVPSENTNVGTITMAYVGGLVWGEGQWGEKNWQ